ncbi:putative glycosyltransferase EpsH [Lachnospiraceae bacterium]|nr:putative glycosyltransferase EpsH [Lachnospiraceae bacterium]
MNILKEKNFAISVIMPVYNTEKYLREAMESIIGQTIGFEENVQVILINDASSDQSDLQCRKIKERYPENVEYISLSRNSGPSFCRNMGIELATGEYVVFTDSDDKWSANAFQRAVQLLKCESDKIDLVSVNLEYFDAYQKPHILNMENAIDIIVDINLDYKKIRTTVPCFIKSEVAKEYRFNEGQMFKEDTSYINKVILRQQRFGMLADDVKYYYRSRTDRTSLVQGWSGDKRYYLEAPRQLYDALYTESLKICGKFVPMMQFVIAYDSVIRFAEPITGLSDEELEQYYDILFHNIQCVDDKMFLEVNCIEVEIKKLLIAYKHNKELEDVCIYYKKKEIQYKEQEIRQQKNRCNCQIMKQFLQIKQDGTTIKDYFEKNRYYEVAIYGFSDLGELLYQELRDSQITVAYIIDRNAGHISADIPILHPGGKLKEVDVIVVTAVYDYVEIREKLCIGNNIPVISLEHVFRALMGR